MRRELKGIVLLVLGLLLIGSIFYFSNYVLRLKQENQQTIHSLSTSDIWHSTMIIQKNISQKKKLVENFLRYIPQIQKDVKLKEVLTNIVNDGEYIQKGFLLQDIVQGKDNALKPLNDFHQNLVYLQKYHFDFVNKWEKAANNWLLILGDKKPQHYLVLFQDPQIPRPTGGLLGAYAVLSFSQGKMSLEGGNIFSLDDVFLNKVVPPLPLQSISDKWFFHDSNWFFDFPSSGRKIAEFYNDLGTKFKVDGVVMVNPDVGGDILSVLGPVVIKTYDLSVTADNFSSFFQNQIQESAKLVTQEASDQHSREYFSLFLSALQNKLAAASSSQLQQIVSLLQDDLDSKDIQLFFSDDNLEYYFDSLNETGKITESNNDYLAVVVNSLQRGFYRDSRKKNITLQTNFSSSGIIDTLTISAQKEERLDNNQENYLQIYLPPGTTIIKANNGYLKKISEPLPYKQLGFQKDADVTLVEKTRIRDEKNNIELLSKGNKTVVTTWARLSRHPFILQYSLPFEKAELSSWELNVQKQSGQQVNFVYNIIPPLNKTIRPTLFPLGKSIPLQNDLDIQLYFISSLNND